MHKIHLLYLSNIGKHERRQGFVLGNAKPFCVADGGGGVLVVGASASVA